jgi:dolichol-phosphate mannosyltransferase
MNNPVDCRRQEPLRTVAEATARVARPVPAAAQLAIVIPTLNERANVAILVDRLDAVLVGIRWEAIFVDDDSSDGTGEILRDIARHRDNIRCIRRVGRRGLASACLEGAASTEASYIAVIDADLQHDERLLPKMLATITDRRLDVVVASRYMANAGVGDWQIWRLMLSNFAGRLARCVVGADLSDPMSGFFVIERGALAAALPRLSGQGFKILLDIFASSPRPLAFAELPYRFRRRIHGQSKLDSRVAWQYLAFLLDRLVDRMPAIRFVLFASVGATGLLIHLAILRLAITLGAAFSLAQAMAAMVGMAGNFLLNNTLTYRDRRLRGAALWQGLLGFYAVCAAGAAANIAVAAHLFAGGWRWWLAGVSGAAVSAAWNYAMSSALVWRSNLSSPSAARSAPARASINPAASQPGAVSLAAD